MEEEKAKTDSKNDAALEAGQRRVNLIWETTQAVIALSVVLTTLYVSAHLALLVFLPDLTERQMPVVLAAFVLISNLASLVIGFYFGRTNHVKRGGIGKDSGER